MKTSDFICCCLGLGYGQTVDEICDNFDIDLDDDEIYYVLDSSRDYYYNFGNNLIEFLFNKIIDEWSQKGLDEGMFTYNTDGDFSRLYYDDEQIDNANELKTILNEK